MRTIAAALTTAQKEASRAPYVSAIAENTWEVVRSPDFFQVNGSANTAGAHDIGVAGDDSITRCRMDSGTVKQQRVTHALAGFFGQWDVWNDLVTGMGTRLAVAAKGTRVIVVYTNAAGTGIRYRESTDSGVTYGADTLITTAAAAVNDLAVAYKNTSGDLAVAFVTAAPQLHVILRAGGTFGAIQTPTFTWNSLNGVGMTFALDYEIVVTGAEVTTGKPTLWSTAYGQGGNVANATWGPRHIQQQADSGVTTYQAPFITISDTYHVRYSESPAYSGGDIRTYRTYMHPGLAWTVGPNAWRAPLPMDHHNAQGIAIAAGNGLTGYTYESSYDTVNRAPRALVTLDLSSDVLMCDVREEPWDARGELTLQNDAGEYAGPPAPIALGNRVKLAFGYTVGGTNHTSQIQDFYVAGWRYGRSGGQSTLTLVLESAWARLRRNFQRSQITPTGDHYRAIIGAILARAGLAIITNFTSARAGATVPKFTILPQTSGYTALRQALSLLADRVRMDDAGECWIMEVAANEVTDYTIGTDHPINELEIADAPAPAGEVQTTGVSGSAIVFGDSVDYADAERNLSPLLQLRDISSDTAAEADGSAVAARRQRQLSRPGGRAVVPPICGLEPLDVIDVADSRINAVTLYRRVLAIRWRLDRPAGVYRQELTLGHR